jgi:hypothetical protein
MPQIQQLPPGNDPSHLLSQALGQLGGAFLGSKYQKHVKEQDEQAQTSKLQKAISEAERDPNLSQEQRQTLGLYKAFAHNPALAKQLQSDFQSQKELQATQEKNTATNTTNEEKNRLYQERTNATANKSKAPVGGLSGIAVPPEEVAKIEKVISENPETNADQLALAFDKAGVIRGHSNSYIESRRRKDENSVKGFESDRAYHTGFSKEDEKEVTQLQGSLNQQEVALNYARQAIESGDVGYFSKDKLADATGIDAFRTAKGAQLITAGKENLLSNMDRVSAKAQNIWFEQRLASMFPKIGQTEEANLTMQEMIEGDAAMKRAYVTEFIRIAKEDQDKYGFVKKDAKQRALSNVDSLNKEIFNRSIYRMKELEEQEKGLSKLKQDVGKKVVRGTPLTKYMAKLYVEKFGSDALKKAKENGYQIPTAEDFRIYEQTPSEFREGK